MTEALFLSSADTAGLVEPAAFVDAVRSGYQQRGEGAPAEPRTKLSSTDPSGILTTYAAVLPQTGVMGGYTYDAGFAAGDAWFITPLFDAQTGEPLAVIDGAALNPFKTGAVGAVGTDILAQSDARVAGIIGSGPQARGQLRALMTVRDLDIVRVFSPTAEHRKEFVSNMNNEVDAPVTITAVDTPREAESGADIVITATTAREPVFDGEDLDPGAHVTAMGQYDANARELDTTTIERATYVPDLRKRATQDAGSFLAAVDAGVVDANHIHAELGTVLTGDAPRPDKEEITVFDSGGTGIETVAGANLLYEAACEADVGTTIEFTPASTAFEYSNTSSQ